MNSSEDLFSRHGGYRRLISFQVAQLVFDVTVRFCGQHIDQRSRTHDQMVQAARSGVQNIVEGSMASATSKKTEMTLTNVARASLGELKQDYLDYLRQHKLQLWAEIDPRRQELTKRRFTSADEVTAWIHEIAIRDQQQPVEVMANAALVLIGVASWLLKRQLVALTNAFQNEGGFSERLYQMRKGNRDEGR
ncbi:MAG TPA: four helix bundle suffix domain-containing protein [Candidatus Omnitrophota bacterium]|nr:four helix bundle suffix domain-containing protein [Candidatus Omnitrophota bacterium]